MKNNFSLSDLLQAGSAAAVSEMPVSPSLVQRGKMRSTWGFDPKCDTVLPSSPALGGAQGRSRAGCAFPSAGKAGAFPTAFPSCCFWPEFIITYIYNYHWRRIIIIAPCFFTQKFSVFNSAMRKSQFSIFFSLKTQIPSSHGEWDLQVLWGNSRGRKTSKIFLTFLFSPLAQSTQPELDPTKWWKILIFSPTLLYSYAGINLQGVEEFQPPFKSNFSLISPLFPSIFSPIFIYPISISISPSLI